MITKIVNYIKAGYAGLCIVSAEEGRVDADMQRIALEIGRPLFVWSAADGMIDMQQQTARGLTDPLDAVAGVQELSDDALVLLHDMHLYLEDADPVLLRVIKNTLRRAKSVGQVMIFTGCRLVMPPELKHDMTVCAYRLPDADTLGVVLDGICRSAGIEEAPSGDNRQALLDAAGGLTCPEAENAFALSIIETGGLNPAAVSREKAQAIQSGGILEIVETHNSLDDLGGLDALKAWLMSRKDAFTSRARAFGLPQPKGVLIAGVPGTGKSLCARITADVLGCPLLRLDVGRLFGSLVGQTEQNVREVLMTAESIAPCVLWIDELEKGFSGMHRSGGSDGGVGARLLGTFLNWMQDKTAPVFVAATANDVSLLPPELLRKGRMDELFFVNLPSVQERTAIWRILIERYGRHTSDFDVKSLARATEGYTGSEIEQIIIDAMYHAFAAGMELTTVGLARAVSDIVPLSRLSAEAIQAMRRWADGRARNATATDKPVSGNQRKLSMS